jgi:hypothetical protein
MVLLQLPSSYFASKIFLEHVKVANDLTSCNKIIGTKKHKALSEVPFTSTSTPAQKKSDSTVMPSRGISKDICHDC